MASSSDSGDWDDADFDVVEAPPTVHSITFNSSGSRFAVAHSRGADVYTLFGAAADATGLPALEPRRTLQLNHRHLASEGHLPSNSSDFFEVDEGPTAATNRRQPPQRTSTPAAGVGLVALLYDTNVLAVVGGGATPCQAPNRVLLFNGEYEQQRITLFGPVARVALQNRRVIALSQTFLTIHDFGGTKLFEEPAIGWAAASPLGSASVVRMSGAALTSMIDKAAGVPSGAAGRGAAHGDSPSSTAASTAGLQLRRMPMDTTNVEGNPIVAYPDQVAGSVAICDWLNPARVIARIAAHRGELDGISLTANGEALVTASDTNTVMRVWNTTTGAKLREVRLSSAPRATFLRSVGLASTLGERASSKPAGFHADLALSLDSRGELKFFFVGAPGGAGSSGTDPMGGGDAASATVTPAAAQPRNGSSLLSTFQFVSSYFASEWHCASVPLPFLPQPVPATQSDAASKVSTPEASGPALQSSVGAKSSASLSPNVSKLGPAENNIIAVDGIARFDLPAALARYSTGGSAGATDDGRVTVTCLAGCGVVVRVAFDTKAGKATIVSRASFAL